MKRTLTALGVALLIGLLPVRVSAQPMLADCTIFPPDNIWNTPIDHLPVHPRSADYVAAIGLDDPVHPDFGSGEWDGGPIGIPFVIVPPAQPFVPIQFTTYGDESDPGPYPVPGNAPIEGGLDADGDRHVLVLKQVDCTLYELYRAFPNEDGSWFADSGAVFDLASHTLRPDGWTSADAAGLPILPGLVRYDEVAAGAITHALRVTAPQTQAAYVWPARHAASDITDPVYPPLGLRLRLRSDFRQTGYAPEVQVILKALQRYGLILADNGGPWFISGAPDERWDNDVLRQLQQLRGRDFEAIDVSSLMLSPGSAQIRSQAPPRHRLFIPLAPAMGAN